MDEQIIDQTQLAEDLSSKIKLEFSKEFLVKPLEPVMVKKEFDKPVAKDPTPKQDKDGVEAIDYDEVETEIKEVESDYRRGVILKVPTEYVHQKADETYGSSLLDLKVGDIILYLSRAGKWFDQVKDSQLLRLYDITAVER